MYKGQLSNNNELITTYYPMSYYLVINFFKNKNKNNFTLKNCINV